MVDFVDVLVDPAVMQYAMKEIVPGILNNSTAQALSQEIWPGEEGQEKFTKAHWNYPNRQIWQTISNMWNNCVTCIKHIQMFPFYLEADQHIRSCIIKCKYIFI